VKVKYKNKKVQKQCTNLKEAQKAFSDKITKKLFATINYIDNAKNLGDIINMPIYHFHHLKQDKRISSKYQYAIDIDGRKSPYRLIITPLDCNEEVVTSTDLKELNNCTNVLLVLEVSKHYE